MEHTVEQRSGRYGALLLILIATVALAAPASALRAQVVDPYTGGGVSAGSGCAPASLTAVPSDYVRAGESLALTTAGQPPNRRVDFYVAGALVSSPTTDAAGRASTSAIAPANVALIDVAVAGPCGTVGASVRGGGVAATETARGFARTGFSLLPWLIAALVCIAVGRELRRRARQPSRAQLATRVKLPRV